MPLRARPLQALALGLGLCLGGQQAVALHAPSALETVDEVTIEAEVSPANANWAVDSLSPAQLINQRDIDLLLDLQLNTVNLGVTPVEPASSLPQQAAVDVRSLSPDVPANPLFPGNGLSFVPSSQAQRPMSEPRQSRGDDDEPDYKPRRLTETVAGWLGLEAHQSQAVTDLRSLRQWLLQNRAALLGGGGLMMLVALAVASLARRSSASAPRSEQMRIPPRRRRRRGTHRSSSPHR